eukprot:GHVP01044470.1.p1 GENE.GHVP01044470.1~~GHVP01044470.1.p1  ORF type:complete len:183 (-),score=38.73 GHVP01044470.1:813-1361(-)
MEILKDLQDKIAGATRPEFDGLQGLQTLSEQFEEPAFFGGGSKEDQETEDSTASPYYSESFNTDSFQNSDEENFANFTNSHYREPSKLQNRKENSEKKQETENSKNIFAGRKLTFLNLKEQALQKVKSELSKFITIPEDFESYTFVYIELKGFPLPHQAICLHFCGDPDTCDPTVKSHKGSR